MNQNRISISKRIKSFKYAFNGLVILIREEHNSRIQLLAAIGVITAGFYFNISRTEWISLIFAIGFVFALELINSSIENISDFVTKEKHELIKKTKDLAAAGVLVSAISALIIGLIIFLPKFTNLF